MTGRFDLPVFEGASHVRFPEIRRTTLDSGLAVWTIESSRAPIAAALLVVNGGAAADPDARPGLSGLAADMMDEGAGSRDAVAIADAFLRLGTHLEIEVGSDVTTFGLTALSRALPEALALVGDVVIRPRFERPDFDRILDLRLNRLRQLSRSPGAAADRVFLSHVFSGHPYGHGALGTTASLRTMSVDDAREFWARSILPAGATLIVAGDVAHDAIVRTAGHVFADWRSSAARTPGLSAVGNERRGGRVLLVDRPQASQSELRVGHGGPSRATPDYHALLTLNAILGGQFSSRINHNLRETRGVTYGARTAFDLRRAGGSFACDASVQADATSVSVSEILREFGAIREPGSVTPEELDLAKSSLTRGYVRNFETAVQLARAAAQLAVNGLGPDEFDSFVERVEALGPADMARVARSYLLPDDCVTVVVGDRERCQGPLEMLGRPVDVVTPEF